MALLPVAMLFVQRCADLRQRLLRLPFQDVVHSFAQSGFKNRHKRVKIRGAIICGLHGDVPR